MSRPLFEENDASTNNTFSQGEWGLSTTLRFNTNFETNNYRVSLPIKILSWTNALAYLGLTSML
jgi:hypothetical protein